MRNRKETINDMKAGFQKEPVERKLFIIAGEIWQNWRNPYFGAEPYIKAMYAMESIDDMYGFDEGHMIVRYFLSNASTWRGEKAREIKAELKAMLSRR